LENQKEKRRRGSTGGGEEGKNSKSKEVEKGDMSRRAKNGIRKGYWLIMFNINRRI
jgi:hypothetical protein